MEILYHRNGVRTRAVETRLIASQVRGGVRLVFQGKAAVRRDESRLYRMLTNAVNMERFYTIGMECEHVL
jgi:hypothetical protein